MSLQMNYQQSLVSVIVPVYNRSIYLKQAIQSALNQTYKNIEIIVSDDCSPESPQAIVESFDDSRIIFRRNQENLGVASNIISAVKVARGKYIASLNDDDIWNDNFLEKLVPQLDNNHDLVLGFCDHYIIDENSNIDDKATQECTQMWKRNQLKEGIYQPFYEIALVNQSVASSVAAVIRKDAIDWDNFPPQAGPFWDLFLTYMACRNGGGAYYFPERLSKYRVHALSETMNIGSKNTKAKIRGAKATIFCFHQFMEDEALQEFKSYFRKQWLHAQTTLAIGLLRDEKETEARPLLLRTLIQQKFNKRTIAAFLISFIPKPLARKLLAV
ncbi:glycosyltransferase family 2 protein [Plectonema cf. radiosum LEGE 06105]|uniref:Glycosyltransferase family 2 protein n=1 Tax=Plectonema cf. radiosum LEGE 06105 TaxID=945769 RepID=A0A8J7JYP7_9CYAN|nr:glycosyltransferase family 2 protein [Plectonema radiosum]MBE9211561.1 glycosyltransferase family 2 protein [Plectonema cf. radiosum LEGE 06105]